MQPMKDSQGGPGGRHRDRGSPKDGPGRRTGARSAGRTWNGRQVWIFSTKLFSLPSSPNISSLTASYDAHRRHKLSKLSTRLSTLLIALQNTLIWGQQSAKHVCRPPCTKPPPGPRRHSSITLMKLRHPLPTKLSEYEL